MRAFFSFTAALALCLPLLVFSPRSAAQEVASTPGNASTQAEFNAKSWLELVDKGDYPASWGQAASAFKAAVTQATWESAVRGVRAPLGAMKSRVLKSAQPRSSLPGAPDGEYVVLQFETQFEHKSSVVETVTPMKDKDGLWRVSGYFVR